jgi:hypothetical protein
MRRSREGGNPSRTPQTAELADGEKKWDSAHNLATEMAGSSSSSAPP